MYIRNATRRYRESLQKIRIILWILESDSRQPLIWRETRRQGNVEEIGGE